jgi:hypothetical protein
MIELSSYYLGVSFIAPDRISDRAHSQIDHVLVVVWEEDKGNAADISLGDRVR